MRMFKRWKLVTSLGLLIVSITFAVVAWPRTPTPDVHYHGGFYVYVDGVKQDYSAYQYMNWEKCSEHPIKKTKDDEQIEKAHLHDSIGDVVHVHRDGSVWGDLFKNIKVTFPADEKLAGYIDGKLVPDIMKQEIEPYQTAIFLVGDSDATLAGQSIPVDYIKSVEAKSELCGSS